MEELLEEYKEGLIDMGNPPEEVEGITIDNPFFKKWASLVLAETK